MVQAGRLIKQALSYERNAEYQEAFDLFKAGVDVLLNGVQSEWFIPCMCTLLLFMHTLIIKARHLSGSAYSILRIHSNVHVCVQGWFTWIC